MIEKSHSILIAGGGVFGFTAALELRARGHAVTLLDQGRVPHPDAASTDISKVVRLDYGADDIYTDMAERSIAGWRAWNAGWERPLFHPDGFLVMTRDEEMPPGGFEAESHRHLTARGHDLRRVRRADLAARHPAWNAARYGDGYLNPAGGWAESGAVVARLSQVARAAGVEIHEECPVSALLDGDGVRTADGREWRAGTTVLATGAWTPFLLPELASMLRTTAQPVVHLRPEDPADYRAPHFPVWGADIGRTGWYGFPATADGLVKVANHGPGRPVTHPDQPRGVTAAEVARFRAFLADTFPGLAGAPIVGTRECWYCDSFDGHFWIDRHPARPGVVVAAGDSGHAFKFAPVLGGLIADAVEGRENPWAARFRWRAYQAPGAEGARATSTPTES
jgi:glycine/D-amino acid oxidase-like deaminating enzyme